MSNTDPDAVAAQVAVNGAANLLPSREPWLIGFPIAWFEAGVTNEYIQLISGKSPNAVPGFTPNTVKYLCVVLRHDRLLWPRLQLS